MNPLTWSKPWKKCSGVTPWWWNLATLPVKRVIMSRAQLRAEKPACERIWCLSSFRFQTSGEQWRMKNSGYVAVGHILASKEPRDYVKTLRYFCSVIFVNLEEDLVCKSHGFGLYDKFMSTATHVTLSSFSKFLSGMLMNQATDELDFQIKVRKIKN